MPVWLARATGWVAWLAILALLAIPAHAGREREVSDENLINVLLSPGLAQWLVGPISRIATPDEVQGFLRLSDDQAANNFIDSFWRKRVDPETSWPGKQLRDIFEERAEEADRLFTEGTRVGRRTDRGVTYVVFGAPEKRSYVQNAGPRKSTVEVWTYSRKSEPGLDGSRPSSVYYFAKRNGVTVFTQRPRKLESIPERRVP